MLTPTETYDDVEALAAKPPEGAAFGSVLIETVGVLRANSTLSFAFAASLDIVSDYDSELISQAILEAAGREWEFALYGTPPQLR